jgi:SOS-response transcriptional repressor LexA
MDLTKRQQEIFDFIRSYSEKNGYPPTVRDIGKAVGLASSSTVHAHLSNLEKLGVLRRDPTKPRALELLDRHPGAIAVAVAFDLWRHRPAAPDATTQAIAVGRALDAPAGAPPQPGTVR